MNLLVFYVFVLLLWCDLSSRLLMLWQGLAVGGCSGTCHLVTPG
jgi:hypothetical protein